MGRFYADTNKLKQDDILTTTVLTNVYTMPLAESSLKSPEASPAVDKDGDIVMAETLPASPPISPFADKFNFEWFSFDGNRSSSSSKPPSFSPVSPGSPSPKLSVDTVSPTSYFTDLSPTSLDLIKTPTNSQQASCSPRLDAIELVLPAPPSKPLAWVWQCHMCRSRYALAVTRRCLVDGHYYCSGVTTPQRNNKRRKGNKSCTSEFDYVGWQDWGQWRRRCMALQEFRTGKTQGPTLVGCEGCSFPSQCRYENRPAEERVEFDKYIKQQDRNALAKALEHQQASLATKLQEEQENKRAAAKNEAEMNEIKSRTPSAESDSKGSNKVIKKGGKSDQAHNQAAKGSEKVTSKRQRFYSSITGNSSNAELNPPRENVEISQKGKFDTNMPSLSISTYTSLVDIDPAAPSEKNDPDEVQAIEATLKVALAQAYKPQTVTASLPATSRRSSRTSTLAPTTRSKQRVNVIATNPSSKSPIQDHIERHRALTQKESNLERIETQRSLISDFFRPSRTPTKDRDKDGSTDSYSETRRAASEADIASFLSLKTSREDGAATRSQAPRANITNANANHFEDINLSPSRTRSPSLFSEVLDPPGGQMDADTDPVKGQAPPGLGTNLDGKVASGGGSSSGGTGAAFLTFGFGRK